MRQPDATTKIQSMKNISLALPGRGFTITEVLIVVVVVAVLAAVAYPSYLSSIRKSRRVDAFEALSRIQQAQERHRSTQPQYTSALTALPTATPPGLGASANSSSGYYSMAIALEAGFESRRYVATATPVAGSSQAADGPCSVLAVRMDGGNLRYGAAATAAAMAALDWSAANVDPQRCWAR